MGALALIFLILGLKNYSDSVHKKNLAKQKEEEGQKSEFEKERNVSFCSKIHEDDFNYQSKFFTKRELTKLTNSKGYSETRKEKGGAVENWNWQTYDRKNGKLMSEEDIKKVEEGDQEIDVV